MQIIRTGMQILFLKMLDAGFVRTMFICVSKKLYLRVDMLGLAGV
jgi:hypothetical protein